MRTRNKSLAIALGRRPAVDSPLGCRRERWIDVQNLDQLLALGKFAVADLLRTARVHNRAVFRGEQGAIDLPMTAGEIQQHLPRLDGNITELRSHLRRSAAAESAHVEGRKVGVTRTHCDRIA